MRTVDLGYWDGEKECYWCGNINHYSKDCHQKLKGIIATLDSQLKYFVKPEGYVGCELIDDEIVVYSTNKKINLKNQSKSWKGYSVKIKVIQ